MALPEVGITVRYGDIRSASDVENFPAVDWVIDAAANPSVLAGVTGPMTSRQIVEHNLTGTINLLEFCRQQTSGFVMLSTSRVYSSAELSNLRSQPLRYIGFGGPGFQVRDCMHPNDLAKLLIKQMTSSPRDSPKILNIGGGNESSISLAQLSAWCANRFGPHIVSADSVERRYDVPSLVLDASVARQTWEWAPETGLYSILEEIARHAEGNPQWLSLSAEG